jgi:hypothetical protein
LSFAKREEIGLLSAQVIGVREIGHQIERSSSTVSRQFTRNAATRGGNLKHRAPVAQWKEESHYDSYTNSGLALPERFTLPDDSEPANFPLESHNIWLSLRHLEEKPSTAGLFVSAS